MMQDDVVSRLLTFPNVIITGHQAFFTAEALQNIAATTLANITAFDAVRTPYIGSRSSSSHNQGVGVSGVIGRSLHMLHLPAIMPRTPTWMPPFSLKS